MPEEPASSDSVGTCVRKRGQLSDTPPGKGRSRRFLKICIFLIKQHFLENEDNKIGRTIVHRCTTPPSEL